MISLRSLTAIAVVTMTVGVFASTANAAEAMLPDGYPECRRGIDGEWYLVEPTWSPFGDFPGFGDVVRISGASIWWNKRDQTRRMTLIEQRDMRQLFRLDRPFNKFYGESNSLSYPAYGYVIVENPMGWLGVQIGNRSWPCAATLTFCADTFETDKLMSNEDEYVVYGTNNCIAGNFVPYEVKYE